MSSTRAAAFVLVLAAAVITAGCASTSVTDWTGHHIDEVIKKFGTPARVTPTGDGGKMYVWEYQRTFADPTWGAGGTVSPNERRCTATRTFMVRPDGIVATWNVQDCIP
jgi:hypothetical protein